MRINGVDLFSTGRLTLGLVVFSIWSMTTTAKKTLGFVVLKNGAAQKTHAYANLGLARTKAGEHLDTLIESARKALEPCEIEMHRWCEGDSPYQTSGMILAFKVTGTGAVWEWNGQFYQRTN